MITRINNNRGRRFLNPLEIEAQYITEDRASNPDLLLWIDFTDVNSLRSLASGGASQPSNGQGIMISQNKSYYPQGPNAGMASAGAKALGKYALQASAANCPVFVDPGDGTPTYATFDGSQFLEIRKGVGSAADGSNLTSSELDCNSFTAYMVCEREEPSSPQRQDVFWMTTNDYGSTNNIPKQHMSFYFENISGINTVGIFELLDLNQASGNSSKYVRYDEPDDTNFHYHMYNSYERYNNNNPNNEYASLQADGYHHQFGHFGGNPGEYPSPTYMQEYAGGSTLGGLAGKTGGLDEVFQFTGGNNDHPSFTIGGKGRQHYSVAPLGTFKGKIYEILIFKSEHSGPNLLDTLFFGASFKKRWSNMLYYFQRKYQYIVTKL